ncbi:MAG: squalene/phytoene synthase family protein [Hyphomicrobiales bacterium]
MRATRIADGAGKGEAWRYCLDLVRKTDKDRFLSALFAPDQHRMPLLALYAFNVETARICEHISEPMLGEIRLEWWHGEVAGLFAGRVGDHPVLRALSGPAMSGRLSRRGLETLLQARRFDLYDDSMPTVDDLESYLDKTSSSLIEMACSILAGEGGATAARAAGVAYGLVGLMRALPIHNRHGQCYIPADLLKMHAMTRADIVSGLWSRPYGEVLATLRRIVRDRLSQARMYAQNLPPRLLPAFLPVSLVDLYLKQLESAVAQSVKQTGDVSQLRKQWRLWSCALRERF